jgi:hypothetical protein
MNCGCGQPADNQGNPANITTQDVRAAADATGQSLSETLEHMQASIDKMEDQVQATGTLTA